MYSVSPLFQKAYSYCKDHYDKVYILSAKYGLLKPDQVIDPYDQTLISMKIWEKKEWSERVYKQFLSEMQFNAWDWSKIQLIAFHAGSEYRRFLVNYFRDKTLVSIPLQGLAIGEQLSFYKREGY